MISAKLHSFKKAFGKQDYLVSGNDYRKTLLESPLVNGLFTVGNSFVIVVNTISWELELVTGNTESFSGYTKEEILNMGFDFTLNFALKDHMPANLATVEYAMQYFNACPQEQRSLIFAVYYYYGVKKNGQRVTVQHQSIPLYFDSQNLPFIFCNIYSDISFLDAQRVPQGMIINKYTDEVLHLNTREMFFEKREEIFSAREKEIINRMKDGKTSRQIADELFLSYETVRTHRKNILRKAGVSSTMALINYSILNSIY